MQVIGIDKIFNKILRENFLKSRKRHTQTDASSTEHQADRA